MLMNNFNQLLRLALLAISYLSKLRIYVKFEIIAFDKIHYFLLC